MPKPSVQMAKGKDPSCLIIAFTGFQGQLVADPFQFFAVCKMLKYSRLLLRDPTRTCFLDGAPPRAKGLDALVALCRNAIRRLAPKTVIVIGSSGGAYAALLYGHLLEADYVHAFSPYTYLDETALKRYGDYEILEDRKENLRDIWALPKNVHPYFNLRKVLKQGNGKTKFVVHACRRSKWDMIRAGHLGGCPNVSILTHACSGHFVASHLARERQLEPLLRLENQPALIERAEKYMAEAAAKKKGN